MNTTHRLALGLLLFLCLLAPAAARANTYTVEGCGTVGTGAFQFEANPSAFNFVDNKCQPADPAPWAQLDLESSQIYAQGAQASWGVTAPAGETIAGLGVAGGWFQGQGGWLAGWTLNGDLGENALPTGDDCLTYSFSSGDCVETVSGWFPVDGASSVQETLACDASVAGALECPDADPSQGAVVAIAQVSDAVVAIKDPDSAQADVSGSLWQAAQGVGLSGGWLSGISSGANLSMDFSASDPGGVCTMQAVLADAAGVVVASSSPVAQTPATDSGSVVAADYGLAAPFSSTQPCGGPDAGVHTFSPDLRALPTGTYYLNVATQNPGEYESATYSYAAGNALARGAELKIDNSIPSVSMATTVQPAADGWVTASETVDVTATDAAGSSGLAQITCTTPAGTSTYPVSGDQATVPVSVSTPGADSLSCDASSVAGNTSTPANNAFRLDSQVPSLAFTGAEPAPAWNTGEQRLTVTGSEPSQASGIASVTCQVDGGSWDTTDGSVAHVVVAGDGKHSVGCYATTVAGISGNADVESIQIDSLPPSLTLGNGPPQGVWTTSAQTVDATAVAACGDLISDISCTLDGALSSYPVTGANATETVAIRVPPPGGELTCQAQDSAGNVSAASSWSLLIDDKAPTGHFVATDPAHPATASVALVDSGSGLAGASIELYVDGVWRPLPTVLDVGTGVASAAIPDSGSLADGTYLLRARAWDRAGNVAFIHQNTAGAVESVTLPLRESTQLSAVVSAGRLRVTATASAVKHYLQLAHGESVSVSGRLRNAHGDAVAHATIVITAQAAGRHGADVVGRVRTDAGGKFSFRLPPGPSRTLRFTYAGSSVLRSASAETAVRVRGLATLSVPRLATPGHLITLRGAVPGGFIPKSGLLVQLWYSAGGRAPVWTPFEHAVRTNAKGAWSLTFPVSAMARGYRYAFRAVLANQNGWSYEGAISGSAFMQVA